MHPGCGTEWTFLNTIEETIELINSPESPYLKLALDTYHYGLQDPNLDLLADVTHRIAVVHLGDGVAAPNGEQDRCQLGAGQVPLRCIIETLADEGYDGFLDIELIGESVESIDYATLIREALAFVEDLVAAT